MEATHFTSEQLTDKFSFPSKFKLFAIGAMILGLVFIGLGFAFGGGSHAPEHPEKHEQNGEHQHHSMVKSQSTVHFTADIEEAEHGHHHHEITTTIKMKSAFLLASFYMLTLAAGAMFFIVIHRAGNAGWHIAVQRIAEAQSLWLPFALILFAIIGFIGGDLYEWRILPEGSDALIDAKRAFLNADSQLVMQLVCLGLWAFAAFFIRRQSIAQDTSSNPMKQHKSMTIASGLYLFFFAVSFTLFCFYWIKSLEPHWFSTIFAVNAFAGSMVSSLSVMTLVIYALKSQGHLKFVNESHMHDISKFMFGFSIFWTYTWLSQYLLIWYANIPEENIYYVRRMLVGDENYLGYRFFFFFNLFINFLLPFLVFMTRNAKRTPKIAIFVAIGLLIGHWNDLFLMTAPGSIGTAFGDMDYVFAAIGMMLLLGGVFAYVLFTNLTRANLMPLKNPYSEESLAHSTGVV